MKRKMKIGDYWLTVKQLETLKSLLEVQETTDKQEVGEYSLNDDGFTIDYAIDDEYDIIIDGIAD